MPDSLATKDGNPPNFWVDSDSYKESAKKIGLIQGVLNFFMWIFRLWIADSSNIFEGLLST